MVNVHVMSLSNASSSKIDYATDYEEWLSRYNNAKHSLVDDVNKAEKTSNANNNELQKDLVTRMVAVRAGRLGSLQCALMEETENVELMQEFYQFTKTEMEADRSAMGAEMKALEAFLPNLNGVIAAASATNLLDVDVDEDAFFEEYPECLRESYIDSDTSDSDEAEDDDDSAHRYDANQDSKPKSKKSRASSEAMKVDNMKQKSSGVKQSTSTTGESRHPMSHLQQQEAADFTKARTKAPSNENSHVHNPYDRTMPRSHAPPMNAGDTPNYSFPSAPHTGVPLGATQAPNNKSQSWEDLRNQNNPFQSAREYGQRAPTVDQHDELEHVQKCAPPAASSFSLARNPYSTMESTMTRGDDGQQDPMNRGQPIRDSLKRKFQPPKRASANEVGAFSQSKGKLSCELGGANGKNLDKSGSSSRPSSRGNDNDADLPEQLKGLDKELVEKIQNEIMEKGESVSFGEIAGLHDVKQTIFEVVCWPMKRPDLFTGLRRAPNGLLLYGPPGTGKTLIGKAIAHESGATFFSISSSSLTSKWIGEGEKLVRTLFAVAAYREPAVVFIDEIDSLLTQRKADENEASRRIKTEFLVQLDGTGTSGQGRVLIIGATNRPQELDDAARRRFIKRLYIPLPAQPDREALFHVLLDKNNHCLTDEETSKLAADTEGFSGADLKALCTDAAMGPIRELGQHALEIEPNDVPPIAYKHFRRALRTTKPSVAPSDLVQYEEWDKLYGSRHMSPEDEDED